MACCGMISARSAVPERFADSVRMDEVIVTGSRPAVNFRNLPMSVSVVEERQIERRFEPSLLPVLTEQVPGLFITGRGVMGYGVAAGAAGGMKIRGVGGEPTSGVLVLIDGHPQYMGLMGHPLADSYQSMNAERVEVVRGPASILYGSNAMGGVVNIITKKGQADGVYNTARLMYGSFNTLNVEVSNAVRKGKFNSFAALNYSHTDGHRKDMGFGGWGGYLKLGYDFTAHWKAFADVNLNHFAASNPGSVTAPLIDNDALITRGMTSFSLDNRYERTSGSLKFFYNFGYHKIDDGHSPGQPSPDYRFRSRDRMLGITAYQSYRLFTGNQTTLGADYQRSGGRAWNRYPNRDEQLADKTLNDVAVYLNMQQTLARWMTLNAGVRMDYNPHFGAQWVPQFGISFPIAPETVLKAILSKGFRTPTIREMYMFPPQNPDLRPERLMNYEFSVTQSFWQRKLSLSANVYYLKGDNTIQAVFDGNRPINVNTGRIENYGVELTARYRAVRSLAFSGNYSWLHMEYKILAAPQHKLYAGIDFIRPHWSVSTGVQYIRGLYTDLKAPGTEQFVLWNLRASWQASSVVELFARGENLLAQDYEINAGYPMPRATVFGGVNLRF